MPRRASQEPAAARQPAEQPPAAIEEVEDEQLEEIDEDNLPDQLPVHEDNEPSDEEYEDEYLDLAQLLVTEEGEPLADVLRGIRDALDKHNKILYKLASAAEKLAA